MKLTVIKQKQLMYLIDIQPVIFAPCPLKGVNNPHDLEPPFRGVGGQFKYEKK